MTEDRGKIALAMLGTVAVVGIIVMALMFAAAQEPPNIQKPCQNNGVCNAEGCVVGDQVVADPECHGVEVVQKPCQNNGVCNAEGCVVGGQVVADPECQGIIPK